MRKFFIQSILLIYTLFISQEIIAKQSLEIEDNPKLIIPRLLQHIDEHIDNVIDYANSNPTWGPMMCKFINPIAVENFGCLNELIITIIDMHVKDLKALQNKILKIETEEPSYLESIISDLLIDRLGEFEASKSRIDSLRITTNEDFKRLFRLDPKTLSPADKTTINILIDAHQIRNLIIIELLSLTNLKNLSQKVKNLISMSPTLWLKIQKIDKDLGLPDEGFFDKSPENPTNKDLYFYQNYCKKITRHIPNLQKSKKKGQKVFTGTVFEYNRLYKPNNIIPPLKVPLFLNDSINAVKDTPTMTPTMISTPNNFNQKKKKRNKKKKPSKINNVQAITLTNANDCIPKVIDNSPIENKPEKSEAPIKEDVYIESLASNSNYITSSIIEKESGEKKEPELFVEASITQDTRSLRKLAYDRQMLEAPHRRTGAYPSVRDYLRSGVTTQLPSEVEFPERSTILSSSDSQETEEIDGYALPDYSIYRDKNKQKAAAKQNTQLSIDSVKLTPIKGHHATTLLDLFDPRAYTNVDFRKFKSLWEYIGGTIEKHSRRGSHRTIIFKDKIKDGIFKPHGKHRGYAPKTIAKIRKILTEIGYNPI